MSENDHARAAQLIFRLQVEKVAGADRVWLQGHLSSCQACTERAAATNRAIHAIRSASVQVAPDLVERTRLQVQRQTGQLRRAPVPGIWFWLMSGVSWAWILMSAAYLWRGFGWAAHRLGIPGPIWQVAFALWWVAAALVLATVLGVRTLQLRDVAHEI